MTTAPTRPRAPQDFRKKAEQDEALDETIELSVDGVVHKITPADLTGLQEMHIRQVTGKSFIEIQQALEKHPGLDYLGMFMWVCRYAAGEDVALEDVLGGISYASDVVFKDDAEPNPPEA